MHLILDRSVALGPLQSCQNGVLKAHEVYGEVGQCGSLSKLEPVGPSQRLGAAIDRAGVHSACAVVAGVLLGALGAAAC